MSFDPLPANIEKGVQNFAAEEHITHDEAILRLIQAGLAVTGEHKTDSKKTGGERPGDLLIGLFSAPADAAVFDEALEDWRK